MKNNRWFTRLYIGLVIIALMGAAAWPISAQPPLPPETPPPQQSQGDYAPGEILVKFKPGIAALGAQRTLAAHGLQVTGEIRAIDVLKLAVEPGRELEAIASLRQNPNVLYAEPNHLAYATDTLPNDLYFNPPYSLQWGLSRIEAPAAWDITTGANHVVIAIVDTGIDLDHPDLLCPGKLTPGYDFANDDSIPDDDNGHGSHVAGIAAACTNNNTGVAGVAWGARLMPVKVLDSVGNGYYDDVAAGIIYAVNQGADIINLSLGGSGGSQTLAGAVQYAYNYGRLVVAATGNNNGPVLYPAAYPEAMAVAATDEFDQRAWFSNYGPETDIAAPGVDIYSTWNGGGYLSASGTSMATPYVAGLAALLWSLNPGLTRDQVRDVIQSTADDLGTPGKDNYFGYGRINARRALESLASLQTIPNQVSFLIDDDSGPFPSSADVRVTTGSIDSITWNATISPPVSWLSLVPPASGMVSAASSDSFTLQVTGRPSTYGTYTTDVIVTGTLPGGGTIDPTTTQVRVIYVRDLYQYRFPLVLKNASINIR